MHHFVHFQVKQMEMNYQGNYNIFLNKAISAHKHLCLIAVSR